MHQTSTDQGGCPRVGIGYATAPRDSPSGEWAGGTAAADLPPHLLPRRQSPRRIAPPQIVSGSLPGKRQGCPDNESSPSRRGWTSSGLRVGQRAAGLFTRDQPNETGRKTDTIRTFRDSAGKTRVFGSRAYATAFDDALLVFFTPGP